MGHERPQRRYLLVIASLAAIVVIAAVSLNRDPYDSAKGVRGVPEFIGQPITFAVARLGEPTKSYEFNVVASGDGMPRANLRNVEPALAPDVVIREVSWERKHTFVTVWYRLGDAGAVGVDAVQWDKRLTSWAEVMASPPAVTTRPAS